MPTRLKVKLTVTPTNELQTPRFIKFVTDHVFYLKGSQYTTSVSIPADVAAVCLYNFTSLMLKLGYAPQYHEFIRQVNGIVSDVDFDESVQAILVPATELMNQLLDRFSLTIE